METTQVTVPNIDVQEIQKKVNEYALQGATQAIKEFYTGYDSPYKKALTEHLKTKGIDNAIEIPDIIGVLNQNISQVIDAIANEAVAKTFIPQVKEFLTRAPQQVKLSEILEQFIEYTKYEYDNDLSRDDYSVSVIKDEGTFLYLNIANSDQQFELHFYLKSEKGVSPKVYEIYMLPYHKPDRDSSTYHSRNHQSKEMMKLSIDQKVVLEIPFTKGIIENEFLSYIARLIIANTQVTFDTNEFNDDMFPDRCHCH